jgi:hypothetical protein
LPDDYLVHHLNGVKDDNRPENLVAMPKGKHHHYLVQHECQRRIRELENEIVELKSKGGEKQ